MPRLWAIALFVYNIDEAAEFYSEVLKLKLVEKNSADGLAVFDLEGIPLLIRLPEMGDEWRMQGGSTNLFIEVDDIQELAQRIKLSKGRILFGPESMTTEQLNMGIEDPFGNQLIITGSPKLS
ncbi:MAG: VOC family protein [Thermoprotei archaeon]